MFFKISYILFLINLVAKLIIFSILKGLSDDLITKKNLFLTIISLILRLIVLKRLRVLKVIFKKYRFWLSLIVLVVLFLSCSTSKDKWQNRKYHQITAHYNAYWNGREAYKEAQRTVDKTFKDDFTKIIPIYKIPDESTAKSIKANTDRAIEKSSKVIKKHSMKFQGVEKNPEIDDAYLLIGKSCLLSRDFKGAEATFKFIINAWKRQKEMYEPMIWLALTYTKQGKYAESDIVIKQVLKAIDENKAPKSLKNFAYLVGAENDIAQGKILPADEKLSLYKGKWFDSNQKSRIKFIQGQIYLQTKQYNKAYKSFQYAYRHAKDYNMQFVAKLNQSLCFETGDYRSVKVINDLEKMLDKPVYRDFQDQIYYAIGEIYYKNNNLDIACKKWEQSVSSSKNNTTQKIASAVRCADVYYNPLENYQKARMYYDTALTLMGKDNVDFKRINDRQKVLANLVDNLNIVQRWDSLLALSELSQQELNKKIDKWITDYKIEQKRKQEQEKLEQAIAARNAQINNFNQNNRNQSTFYFYNPTTVQSGKIEFERRWGKRALDDNWRLTQKEEIGFEQDSALVEQNDSLQTKTQEQDKSLTPDKREYYTKDIPYTQAAKDTANSQIANALLDAGYIFWQGINNLNKAVETFLDLHRRYPQHANILPSSYHLYRVYEQLGDYPNSNYYKNKILKDYPNSEYAAMVQNPDFWQQPEQADKKQDSLYASVYQYYINKEFNAAINQVEKAIQTIKVGPYITRILYIEALCKGKLYGADSLADNLNMIIFNYPNSDIAPVIEKQLQYLASNYDVKQYIKYDKQKEEEFLASQNKQSAADSIVNAIAEDNEAETVNKDDILDPESMMFKYKDGVHYYILLADDSKFDVNYLQQIIEEFNNKSFGNLNLKTRANLFTTTYQIVNVMKFPNMQTAYLYFDSIQNDSTFKNLNPLYYKHFIISLQNYATFYNRRNIDAYLKFFRIMYLNNRDNKEDNDE